MTLQIYNIMFLHDRYIVCKITYCHDSLSLYKLGVCSIPDIDPEVSLVNGAASLYMHWLPLFWPGTSFTK